MTHFFTFQEFIDMSNKHLKELHPGKTLSSYLKIWDGLAQHNRRFLVDPCISNIVISKKSPSISFNFVIGYYDQRSFSVKLQRNDETKYRLWSLRLTPSALTKDESLELHMEFEKYRTLDDAEYERQARADIVKKSLLDDTYHALIH